MEWDYKKRWVLKGAPDAVDANARQGGSLQPQDCQNHLSQQQAQSKEAQASVEGVNNVAWLKVCQGMSSSGERQLD